MQLADATTGLEYMHSLDMAHGDLKGVQSFQLLAAQAFIMKTRQTSSLIKIIMPALQILVFQP